MATLTEAELRQLIAGGETSRLEFKIAAPRSTDLAERMCGLANAWGGRIILGVEDGTLALIGITNPGQAIDIILRAARLVEPVLVLDPPEPELYRIGDTTLVVVTIPPTTGPIYQAGGVCWIRRGTHTVPLSVNEVLELAGSRGLMSWERQAVAGATLADIDPAKVEAFLGQRTRVTRLPGENLSETLIGLDCAIRIYDGGVAPTNAGLLFFGHQPQRFIHQSDVMCVLFDDVIGVGGYIDRRVVTGTVPELIDGVESFLRRHMAVSGKVVGFKRVDMPEFPIEALREAVVNAVVHRDYSRVGESVRVFFYPDRIEIHSPGLLLPQITVEQMAQGNVPSKLRNPILANLLRDLPGYMERMGSGIRYMLYATRENGLPTPQFIESTEFVVTFRKTRQDTVLPDERMAASIVPTRLPESAEEVVKHWQFQSKTVSIDQERRLALALHYIQQHGYITNKAYRDVTGTSEATALRDLEFLVSTGALVKEGITRSRRYRLP